MNAQGAMDLLHAARSGDVLEICRALERRDREAALHGAVPYDYAAEGQDDEVIYLQAQLRMRETVIDCQQRMLRQLLALVPAIVLVEHERAV